MFQSTFTTPNLIGISIHGSVGDFDIGYPIILTPEQYLELVRKEGMKDYFKEKSDAYSGKKEGSEAARKNLLPNFYVNNNFFEIGLWGQYHRSDSTRIGSHGSWGHLAKER